MKLKQRQDRARELESQIAALEAEIASEEESLANFVSAEESIRVAAQLEKRRAALNALLAGMGRGVAGSMSDFQEQLAHLRKRIARIDKKYTRPNARAPIPKPQPPTAGSQKTGCTAKKWQPRTASITKPSDSTNASDGTAASASWIWRISRTICWIPFRMARFAAFRLRNGASWIPKPRAWPEARALMRFWSGVGRITPQGFRVRQFFMRDFGEEASQLSALTEHLKQFEVLITYNGRTYDQPLLETRFRMARQRPPFSSLEHLDLLLRRAPAVELAIRQLPVGGA